MEQRMAQPAPVSQGTYPPLPPSARPKPVQKRPSAIVNKEAVARVQAQQAAMKANAAHGPAGKAAQSSGLSPQDMQGLGETLGDTLRTFRQAAADVRNAVDPEMRTIRAEMDAAQKEIEQSMEAARQMPAVHEDPPQSS
jgi:Sec-independent protein translocase protein TatA